MTRIELQLKKSRQRTAELQRKKREEEARRKAKLKPKSAGRKGRPRVNEDLIIKAIKKAVTRPLADVALSLGISVATLRNYGVTRRALNGKSR